MKTRHVSIVVVCAFLLPGIAALAQQASQEGPGPPTAFFFVQRTKGHLKYSKSEVFLEVVDDVSAYLNKNRVALAKDEFGGRTHAEADMPLATVLDIARDSHATCLLYLIVDRPVTKWIKVTLRAYDLSGKQFWQEETASGGGFSGAHGLRVTLERLHKLLDRRLGQEGLPLIPAAGKPSEAAPQAQQ
jgi:hypothetical protein